MCIQHRIDIHSNSREIGSNTPSVASDRKYRRLSPQIEEHPEAAKATRTSNFRGEYDALDESSINRQEFSCKGGRTRVSIFQLERSPLCLAGRIHNCLKVRLSSRWFHKYPSSASTLAPQRSWLYRCELSEA